MHARMHFYKCWKLFYSSGKWGNLFFLILWNLQRRAWIFLTVMCFCWILQLQNSESDLWKQPLVVPWNWHFHDCNEWTAEGLFLSVVLKLLGLGNLNPHSCKNFCLCINKSISVWHAEEEKNLFDASAHFVKRDGNTDGQQTYPASVVVLKLCNDLWWGGAQLTLRLKPWRKIFWWWSAALGLKNSKSK